MRSKAVRGLLWILFALLLALIGLFAWAFWYYRPTWEMTRTDQLVENLLVPLVVASFLDDVAQVVGAHAVREQVGQYR